MWGRFCGTIILLVLLCPSLEAQVVFWNLENYFDAVNDPITDDDDFTPMGYYHHTRGKFEAKRNLIAKGIIAISDYCGGEMPTLIGFSEIENREVLENLLENTPLAKCNYAIVHKDSPDMRGIDVALLYDTERFEVIEEEFIQIDDFATRDILYVRGFYKESGVTLDIFVNHWPSKRGSSTDYRRETVATILTQRILALPQGSNILVCGDFNDTPDSRVMIDFCEATALKNITAALASKNSGTLKYKGKWELIDQFLISSNYETYIEECVIFRSDFLLEPDKAFLGVKPKRTYIGPRYNGGASDHLPILLRSKPHY